MSIFQLMFINTSVVTNEQILLEQIVYKLITFIEFAINIYLSENNGRHIFLYCDEYVYKKMTYF